MRKAILIVVTAMAMSVFIGCRPQPQGVYRMPQATIPGTGMTATGGGDTLTAATVREKLIQQLNESLKLQKKNQELSQANRQLIAEKTKLTADLAQATGELNDANAMLAELKKELDKWKKDVLGFREEIRLSQRTQLDLMKKLVVLLGGEIPKIKPDAPKKLASKTKDSGGE